MPRSCKLAFGLKHLKMKFQTTDPQDYDSNEARHRSAGVRGGGTVYADDRVHDVGLRREFLLSNNDFLLKQRQERPSHLNLSEGVIVVVIRRRSPLLFLRAETDRQKGGPCEAASAGGGGRGGAGGGSTSCEPCQEKINVENTKYAH